MTSTQPDAAATSTLLLQAAEFGDLAALQRALADGASATVSTSRNNVIMSRPPHFVWVRGCFSEMAGERCCRMLSLR